MKKFKAWLACGLAFVMLSTCAKVAFQDSLYMLPMAPGWPLRLPLIGAGEYIGLSLVGLLVWGLWKVLVEVAGHKAHARRVRRLHRER